MLKVSRSPYNLIVRRNVGVFNTIDGRWITVGKRGEADTQGFIGNQKCPNCRYPIHPKPFAIEVKSAKGEQRELQIKWENETWVRRGGIYIMAKSEDNEDIDKLLEV